ncbi:MAG: TniB family NTP-binding protein [Dissulfurispiraceae bacterium]
MTQGNALKVVQACGIKGKSIPVKKDFGTMTIQDKVHLIEHIFISHPQLKNIVAKIDECHQDSKISTEPKCLFITGRPGCGKTTIARFYESRYPRKTTAGGTEIPVLSSTIFSPATVKGMATGLLYSLGDPLADKGTITSQTLRLYNLIKDCKTELIVLDEFQHLIDKDSNKVLQVASDWLKNLLNETAVPMVLIGMPTSVKILDANEQLRRRFLTRMSLKPFGWNTEREQKDFITLLKFIEKALPLKEISGLYSYETAFRLYCASRGVISNLMKIVRRAAILAVRKGLERISPDLLIVAYEDEMETSGVVPGNPFMMDRDKLTAPQPDQDDEKGQKKSVRERAKTKLSDVLSTRN